MMQKSDGGKGHALPGPEEQTGGSTLHPKLIRGGQCPMCKRRFMHKADCLIYKAEKSSDLPAYVPECDCAGANIHAYHCPLFTPPEKPKSPVPPSSVTVPICPQCSRTLYHHPECPLYEEGETRAVPDPMPEEPVDAYESKRLLVQFIEQKTKEYILELHLDYEMSGVLPAVGDFVSPFGAQDPRVYKVLLRHFILDQQPLLAIYLEKVDG